MPPKGIKNVGIPIATYNKIEEVQRDLAKMLNRRITKGDVMQRAVECLDDAHNRGAWLSPREAAPVLEERHERDIVNVLGQFATHLGLPVAGFKVNRSQWTLQVVLEDGRDVMLFDPALGPATSMHDEDQ